MRRTLRRLFDDDFGEIAYKMSTFNTNDEKAAILKQANLIHVGKMEQYFSEQSKLEGRRPIGGSMSMAHGNGYAAETPDESGNAASGSSSFTNPPLMSTEEIGSRVKAFDDAHDLAASRMDLTDRSFGRKEVNIATKEAVFCHAVPPQWGNVHVNGWVVAADSSLPMPEHFIPPLEGSPEEFSPSVLEKAPFAIVSKTFTFLDQPGTYKFFASVAAAVEELGLGKYDGRMSAADIEEVSTPNSSATSSSSPTPPTSTKSFTSSLDSVQTNGPIMTHANCLALHPLATPKIEWMWSEITVTMIATTKTLLLAQFLNDLEFKLGTSRNMSQDGLKKSDRVWSAHLEEKIERRAGNGFMWMFNNDKNALQNYVQSTYIQWSNRAEYLISRKSRERREFRPDMTLTTVIQQGAERKRRSERRKFKDKISEAGAKAFGMEKEDFERYSFDVVPREVRERMDEDRSKVGGMREFEHRAGGVLAFSRPLQ